MTVRVYKQVYVIPELGELGRTPDGAITNIGGTIYPTFTVGGKGLLFSDGSTTDGSPSLVLSLQTAYNASGSPAVINLSTGKNLVFNAGSNSISIDAATGTFTITGNLVVNGLINGIDLVTLVTEHLDSNPVPSKHTASQISVDDSAFASISGSDVQQVLQDIDSKLTVITGGDVTGFEYTQATPAGTWIIPHNQNSQRIQVTVYDDTNHVIFPDSIGIDDLNTLRITFNTPVAGRAVLMIY